MQEGKDGSVYIYTHKQVPFSGMLKIGYTCSNIQTRLSFWAECGHGYPTLLWSRTGVRHPRRVELLTHFELIKFWHEQQYCSFHSSTHVEWFKTDVGIANSIISDWSSWMGSNPYDRRCYLKVFWDETVDFLAENWIPLTAKTILQLYQLEVGILELSGFMDDKCEREERSTTTDAKDEFFENETFQTRSRCPGSEQPAIQPPSKSLPLRRRKTSVVSDTKV